MAHEGGECLCEPHGGVSPRFQVADDSQYVLYVHITLLTACCILPTIVFPGLSRVLSVSSTASAETNARQDREDRPDDPECEDQHQHLWKIPLEEFGEPDADHGQIPRT